MEIMGQVILQVEAHFQIVMAGCMLLLIIIEGIHTIQFGKVNRRLKNAGRRLQAYLDLILADTEEADHEAGTSLQEGQRHFLDQSLNIQADRGRNGLLPERPLDYQTRLEAGHDQGQAQTRLEAGHDQGQAQTRLEAGHDQGQAQTRLEADYIQGQTQARVNLSDSQAVEYFRPADKNNFHEPATNGHVRELNLANHYVGEYSSRQAEDMRIAIAHRKKQKKDDQLLDQVLQEIFD